MAELVVACNGRIVTKRPPSACSSGAENRIAAAMPADCPPPDPTHGTHDFRRETFPRPAASEPMATNSSL
jgi:hypothetical protein